MTAFHDVLFPLDISLGSHGGPQRLTEIVTLGSGREARNTRWAHARRRYDAGTGITSLAALAKVIAFFEERRGRLYGFRWRDGVDDRSCAPGVEPGPTDQPLGTGDGLRTEFALVKIYGSRFAPYARPITKPVAGSLRVAVGGIEVPPTQFTLDALTGRVRFAEGHAPQPGAEVRAGFLFDVPVRFDTDHLDLDHTAVAQGRVSHIPLIELLG
jgi:uncharacterized protein (TIGR02217 family)